MNRKSNSGGSQVTMRENLQKLRTPSYGAPPARFLDSNQVAMIEEALASLGEFGEVRLVVEKGRLRFLVTQKSFDAQKWRPGTIATNGE
jgi:hypothetical protein